MFAVVAVIALLIGGVGAWLATVTLHDARIEAERSAAFRAQLSATAIGDTVTEALTQIASLAAGLPVPALLANPSKCQLNFGGVGVFSTGHIDIVLPDGTVPCSSLTAQGAPADATQAGADWLQQPKVAHEPTVAGLFTDRLTEQRALAVTAPVIGSNGKPTAFTSVVLPLAGLQKGLARSYGGPQQFAFTIRDATGQVLIGSPHHPAGTRFQPAGSQIAGEHVIGGLGWVLTAEQPRNVALGVTRTAFLRLAALGALAFVLLVALLAILNRHVARPLRQLTTAAGQAARQMTPDPVAERGPAEVRALAAEFNTMITAQAGYEAQLEHHALHDPLTGLPNRALCLDRLGQALQAIESDGTVGVLSIDLDRFKLVNASLGYNNGDQVLTATTTRIRSVLWPADTLARSGDGFVVIRPEGDVTVTAADLAGQLIACMAEPFVVDGTEVALTVSIGVALGRRAVNPEQLLRDADTAMFAAKDAGGGRFRLIDDELRAHSSERLGLEADLRGALGRGELHVVYQPLVDLLSGQITGAEALLRWTHPVRGPVPPVTFIPVAENAGLIGPIGQYVLETACQQAADWAAVGHQLRLSVNMSGLQLHAAGFAQSVQQALHVSGLEPEWLCLELTESVLMDDAMRGVRVLQELKDLGVYLSIDDFGTGYSSLAYLQRFPVDELKIDRLFVQTLAAAGQDPSLVAAMVAMAHALGLHVVAEGVETEGQRAALLTLGCRAAQGYLFSKPQPPDRISALLAAGPLGVDARRPMPLRRPRS